MAKMLSVPCIRVRQKGKEIYLFQISGKKLLSLSFIQRRSENSRGIQRALKRDRANKIGRFIDSEKGMFPNAIIVNIEQKAKFIPSKEDGDIGILELEDKQGSLWIVDGQHRLFGFEHSEQDFPVIVSSLIDASLEEKKTFFF